MAEPTPPPAAIPSAAQLAVLLATSRDGVLTLDRDFRFTYVNPAAARAFGGPPELYLGREVFAALPDVAGTAWERHYRAALGGREAVHFEARYEPTGAWYDVSIYPDGDGGVITTFRDTTERKRAEAELARANALLAAVLKNAPVGVATFDRALRYTEVNDALCAMNGLPREAHLGKTLGEAFPGHPLVPMLAGHVERVVRGGEAVTNVEVVGGAPAHPSDGFALLSFYPMRVDGEVAGAAVLVVDLTERRRIERELAASEARARRLQEAGNIGVAVWRGDRLVDANDALCRMLGFGRDALRDGGVRWAAITPPEYAALDARALGEAAATGASAPFEKEYLTADGRRLPVLVAVARWEGEADAGVAWMVDLSERRRAEAEREAALARAERERARFEELLRDAPALVNLLAGPEHVFAFVNERYAEFMPGARAFLGRPLRDAQPELVGQGIVDLLDRVYRTGEPFVGREVPVEFVRGGRVERCYFTFSYQAIRSADGAIEGVASFAFDVTEPVLARQKVEELARREEAARRQAEEASRAKDEFLATLSHELRTPLNAILGWANLLRVGALPEAQRAKALETVERNARAQARLVDDLLDLSRIAQGKVALRAGPVDATRFVAAAIEAVGPAAGAKGVRLEADLGGRADLVGDEGRLQQVAWNLLSNAVKFTPAGGLVRARLRREGAHVELAVADTGRGIAPEFLPHVFERFRQADGSIARQFGGLGLGLAIVRTLVELHGGEVTAASEGPGRGATFVVRLPAAPARADGDAASGPPPPAAGGPPELEGLRVLIVDDDADARAFITYLLEQCRANVTATAGAAEALDALRAGRFDVLVSDVGMPGEDGYALLRRVRALPAGQGGGVPALALTAYAGGEDRAAARRAGFQMHVAKPVEAAELLAAVAALAGR